MALYRSYIKKYPGSKYAISALVKYIILGSGRIRCTNHGDEFECQPSKTASDIKNLALDFLGRHGEENLPKEIISLIKFFKKQDRAIVDDILSDSNEFNRLQESAEEIAPSVISR